MDKEKLYERIHTMIQSSTKKPKCTALSTVKLADILETDKEEVEKLISELVNEGRLKTSKLEEPPHSEIYMLS